MDYPDLIRKTRRYLTIFPNDSLERLNLAWYYMQNAQPDSALAQYDKLLAQDPSREIAAAGGLWACNVLSHYRETLSRADRYLRQWPHDPNILNHRALARLNLFSPLRARKDYAAAKKLSGADSLANSIAENGIAWSHLYLADYAGAARNVEMNPPASKYTLLPLLKRWRLGASLGMGYKNGGDPYYLFGASLGRKTLSLAFSGEEYLLDGEHYRTSLKLDVDKQFAPVDIKLAGQALNGIDDGIYPAWQAGISASGKIYASSFLLRPLLTSYYAYFQSFSSLQADFGLRAGNDRFKLQVIYSGLYLDNEAMNADRRGKVLSLSAEMRVWRGIQLSLNASRGDMAWWTNANGILMDTYYPDQAVYGLGLRIPLDNTISLSLYQQLGITDESNDYLAQGALRLAF